MSDVTEIELLTQVFDARLKALADRLTACEGRVGLIDTGIDGDLSKIWESITKSQEQITKLIADHAMQDEKALAQIQHQMLTRVPAWALVIMTMGASLIGGMATWILNHLK